MDNIVALLLDDSASMQANQYNTEKGVNRFIELQKTREDDAVFYYATFGAEYTERVSFESIFKVEYINYAAHGWSTVLFDSVRKMMLTIKRKIKSLPEDERPRFVTAIIQTDGGDNASRGQVETADSGIDAGTVTGVVTNPSARYNYTPQQWKAMEDMRKKAIDEMHASMRDTDGIVWRFIFLGDLTDSPKEAHSSADTLGIPVDWQIFYDQNTTEDTFEKVAIAILEESVRPGQRKALLEV